MPSTIAFDAETKNDASKADLRQVGLYQYMGHDSTDVILARLRIDMEDQFEWRPGMALPQRYVDAFNDPDCTVVAHNAAFERILMRDILAPRYGWPQPPPLERWECTMARARANGLPGTLEGGLSATGAPIQKDMAGHRLMMQMCKPRAYNADGSIVWWDDDDRMRRLGIYCGDDVNGSLALMRKTQPLPPSERSVWRMTERMNDAGVRFDRAFCLRAAEVATQARTRLDAAINDVTGGHVSAATKVAQLKRWLMDQGVDLRKPPDPFSVEESEDDAETDAEQLLLAEDDEEDALPEMRKGDVQRLLLTVAPMFPPAVGEALRLRLEAGKTSTKKLETILRRTDAQGYARGLLAYHGAGTGRYAAMGGVQIQNFPRETIEDWDVAWNLMQRPDADEGLELFFGPTLDTISRMLRGSIIPDPGCDIISVDYSAVELRGVAWLAGQWDLVEKLRKGGKVYEEMAAAVFDMDVAEIGKESRERWVGKQIILGSGYQMGTRKFWMMCAAQGVMLDADVAERSIGTYRRINKAIVSLWYGMNGAAISAVREPGKVVHVADGRIRFLCERGILRMRLPSSRMLRYRNPRIVKGRFGHDALEYDGVNPKTKRWAPQQTFGGRLTENAVQAICRDLLVEGTMRVERTGIYRPMTLVHDELVSSVKRGQGDVREVEEMLCVLPAWAEGFPLKAEGWRGERYA